MVSVVDSGTVTGASRAQRLKRQSDLYRRLEDGYQRIERALDEGRDVHRWEEFWLTLLQEYELLSDELAEDID
jgi:DNA-binding transcriptional regulator GbsR (MarR family)